jgi:hypothetical protein
LPEGENLYGNNEEKHSPAKDGRFRKERDGRKRENRSREKTRHNKIVPGSVQKKTGEDLITRKARGRPEHS